MSSRWYGVVVDSADPARLSRWWAEVLGYRILVENATEVTVGPADADHPVLRFERCDPTRAGQSRLHLDLGVDDHDAEVERLVNMGARPVDSGRHDRPTGAVLADPEGNEFSVLHHQV